MADVDKEETKNVIYDGDIIVNCDNYPQQQSSY